MTPSPRRRRTVAARLVDGVLEVRVPAWMSVAEREKWAERMRARIERQVRRAGPTDEELERRAALLNRRVFAGRLRWSSIAYAGQERRWGSCSPESGRETSVSAAPRMESAFHDAPSATELLIAPSVPWWWTDRCEWEFDAMVEGKICCGHWILLT